MHIGELNRRIEVIRFQEVHDEYGGIDGVWIPLLKRWAKIEDNGGAESFENDQNKAQKSLRITIRHTPQIQEIDRIKFQNRLFEIESLSDHNTGHYMTVIICKEIINNGL